MHVIMYQARGAWRHAPQYFFGPSEAMLGVRRLCQHNIGNNRGVRALGIIWEYYINLVNSGNNGSIQGNCCIISDLVSDLTGYAGFRWRA